MIASQNPLVFFLSGQGGTWVLVAMNSLSTGLTCLTSNGCLLWLIDCVGRMFVHIQRVSTVLGKTGPDSGVSQKAHLFWQEAQTGLTSWTGTQTSSFLLLFLIWPVGSGTNTIKEKGEKKNIGHIPLKEISFTVRLYTKACKDLCIDSTTVTNKQ